MGFIACIKVRNQRGDIKGFFCRSCDSMIAKWSGHLPHCTKCGEHHSSKLSCEDTAKFLEADSLMGDATP